MRGITFATIALLVPAMAQAQATAVAGGSPDHIDLSLPVTASVQAQCSFASGTAPNGSFAAADILAGFTHDFGFAMQCNAPCRVAVQSANGGLYVSMGSPPAGYANLAHYSATLNLAGDVGVTSVNAICDSATLTASAATPCSFRGPASATQGLKLNGTASNALGSYLRVSAPIYSGSVTLIASSAYTDTLTVTLSAAL